MVYAIAFLGVNTRECFPEAFLQMKRAEGRPQAVTGLHSGPGSRAHQAVVGYREERCGDSNGLADRAQEYRCEGGR